MGKKDALGLLIKAIYSSDDQSPPEVNKLVVGFMEKDQEGEISVHYLTDSDKKNLIEANKPGKD